jgi:hypothetical protein
VNTKTNYKDTTRNNGKLRFCWRAMSKNLYRSMHRSKIRSSLAPLSTTKWFLTRRLRLFGFYWQHTERLDASCFLQITNDLSLCLPDRQLAVLYSSQMESLVQCGWGYLLSTYLQYSYNNIKMVFSSVKRRLPFITNRKTKSMKRNPSWEASSSSATQESPYISLNPKVHCRVHKSSQRKQTTSRVITQCWPRQYLLG